jgi:hypothetical protein
MTIHPDTHERITKLQKDVEQIKEELEDQWHERRQSYEDRVKNALKGDNNATVLYLEIDAIRTLAEIEKDLVASKKRVSHATLWRAAKRMAKAGLIKKIGAKKKSPIYTKKPWAIVLDLDSYVRSEIL